MKLSANDLLIVIATKQLILEENERVIAQLRAELEAAKAKDEKAEPAFGQAIGPAADD